MVPFLGKAGALQELQKLAGQSVVLARTQHAAQLPFLCAVLRLGPTDVSEAQQMQPSSLRAKFGRDNAKSAVYVASNARIAAAVSRKLLLPRFYGFSAW
jgi:hypothetical protein